MYIRFLELLHKYELSTELDPAKTFLDQIHVWIPYAIHIKTGGNMMQKNTYMDITTIYTPKCRTGSFPICDNMTLICERFWRGPVFTLWCFRLI